MDAIDRCCSFNGSFEVCSAGDSARSVRQELVVASEGREHPLAKILTSMTIFPFQIP